MLLRHQCVVLASWLVLAGPPAVADVISLTDGRTFEGEIIASDDASVTIDSVISNVRVKLTLRRVEIESIEERPVPDDFFEQPVAARQSKPEVRTNPYAYLEAPLIGEFGVDISSEGFRRLLQYAKKHAVRHVVVVVDSSGGEPTEAGAIYDLMKRYEDDVTFHAVLRNCEGPAIAAVVLADTFTVVPGARVGGTETVDLSAAAGGESDELQNVYRAALADDIVSELQSRGRPGEVVRAMIDPAAVLAAWMDDDGGLVSGQLPPADLAENRLVFKVGAGELLTLDHDECVKLGIPSFNGDLKGLGERLDLPDFQPESGYGSKVMADAAKRDRQRAATANAAFARKVEKNIEQREKTERYLERNLRRAAEWAPDKGEYARYNSYYHWGWGAGTRRGGTSGQFTNDSRFEYRMRTDFSTDALQAAAKAARSLQSLDRQAVKLGLEPSFPEGELAWMIEDLNAKYLALKRMRHQRGR